MKRRLIRYFRNMEKGVAKADLPQAAAGLAYYALFSIFPLLLLLVSIGSRLLDEPVAAAQIFRFIDQAVPGLQGLARENIPNLEEQRGSVGAVGFIALFWSASNAFMALNSSVNAAWTNSGKRSFIQKRLLALGIVGILVIALILYVSVLFLLRFLSWLQIPLFTTLNFLETQAWAWLSGVIAWLLVFGLLSGIYRWVPSAAVPRRSALLAALLATLLLFTISQIFTLLSAFMIQRYELVYGSLSSILAFLVYIYFGSFIVLAGAHFSAAISAEEQGNE